LSLERGIYSDDGNTVKCMPGKGNRVGVGVNWGRCEIV